MALFDLPGRRKKPQDVPALVARGEACIRRGDFAAAVTWFDRALDSDPRSVQAYAGKGVALKNLGRDGEARACYDSVLEYSAMQKDRMHANAVQPPATRQGKGTETRVRPGEGTGGNLPRAAEPADRISADAWYEKAVRYAEDGDFAKAVNCFDKALEIEPRNADAWVGRGRAFGKLGKFPIALGSFDHALALRPDDPDALYYKGTSFALMRNIPEAYACFETALQAEPGHEKAAAALEDLGKIITQVKDKKHPGGTGGKGRKKTIF